MAERYALVIDDDTTFRDRISELLAPHAIEVSSTADEAEALSLLENLHPVLVILAVELPDKNGFALFRKVKNTDFDVPIIITTATLTKAELSRHETQPSHAEYYLDKTNLSDSDLLEAIAKAGRLELTTRNVVSRAKPVAADDDDDALQSSGTDVDPRLARYLDDETSAIFARLDKEALEERNHRNEPTPQGEVSAQHVAELESEVDRLAEELEQTRRDGRSSPFSKEFVKLRDVASQKDDEIRALIDALTGRDSQVSIVRRKLSELVKRFAGPEGSEVEAQDELQALSEELDESRAKSRELAEQLDATEREHKQEIADLAKRLVNTQRDRDQGQDAAKTLRGRLEGVESTLGEVREQSDKHSDDQQRDRKDLTKRIVTTQRERDRSLDEATELKRLLESLEVKHDELASKWTRQKAATSASARSSPNGSRPASKRGTRHARRRLKFADFSTASARSSKNSPERPRRPVPNRSRRTRS